MIYMIAALILMEIVNLVIAWYLFKGTAAIWNYLHKIAGDDYVDYD